jgi:hypothetical protein
VSGLLLLLVAILPPTVLVIVYVLIICAIRARIQTTRDRAYASWFGLALAMLVAVVGTPALDKLFNVGWDIFDIYVAYTLPLVVIALLSSLGGTLFSIAAFLKRRDWLLFGITAINVLILGTVALAQINRNRGSFLDSIYFLPVGVLCELILFGCSGWWFLIGQKKAVA